MYFLYDFLLFLSVLFLIPQILWRRFVRGQFKHRWTEYFSLSLPKVKTKEGKVFLIYAVSMGETKIAATLFQFLKEKFPEAQFYLISRSETGHAEGKRSLSEADGHFFLPLDFSWTMNRFLQRINPDVVILIESDFWLNFLRVSKQLGALVCLVNGKISKRSFERFKKVSFFSKKLFSFFDVICVQNDLFEKRLIELGVNPSTTYVTGNLKFDIPFFKIDSNSLKKELGIRPEDKVLVIASTHPKEEEALLRALTPVWDKVPSLKIILVPRHPERFLEVETMLVKKAYPMISYSKIEKKTGLEKVILIDAMGVLLSMYQIADLAIVGGSFFNYLKGHNIFEPIQAGIPVLFGPYMSNQKDLVEILVSHQAGIQSSLEDLSSYVARLFLDASYQEEMKKQGSEIRSQVKGASLRASEAICRKISFSCKETFVI